MEKTLLTSDHETENVFILFSSKCSTKKAINCFFCRAICTSTVELTESVKHFSELNLG